MKYTEFPLFLEVDHVNKKLFLIKRGNTRKHLQSRFIQNFFLNNIYIEELLTSKKYRFFLVQIDEALEPRWFMDELEEIVDKYNLGYMYFVSPLENVNDMFSSTDKVKLVPSTLVNFYCKYFFKYFIYNPDFKTSVLKKKFFMQSGVGRLGRYNFIRKLNLDELDISYRINAPTSESRIFDIFHRATLGENELQKITEFISKLPLNNIPEEDLQPYAKRITNHYQFDSGTVPYSSFLEIVNESYSEFGQKSEIIDSNAILLTEKVFKPMFRYRPFIVNANPGYYSYLRKAGFKTFSKYWDESFDEILDFNLRHDKLIEQIRYINSLNFKQIETMFKDMEETLLYNARHAYNLTFFKKPDFYTYL